MKKGMAILLSVLLLTAFIACTFTACTFTRIKSNSADTIESNYSQSTVPDVSLVLQTFTNKGLTFIINNETQKEYTYGEDYKLYVCQNNIWKDVPYILDNWAFRSIGYILKANSSTEKMSVDWVWLYGELPDGKYKFEKRILDVKNPGDYDTQPVSDEFELVNGEAVKVIRYTLSKLDKNSHVLASKDFEDGESMKNIRDVYFYAMTRSTMISVTLSSIQEFYEVKTTYSNGETSKQTYCVEKGQACMIYAKEKEASSSEGMALPVDNDLFVKMITLLQ